MPKTLLLADDSVTIQKVVGISFASEDIEITTVDNGNDALAKARALRPDVILADVVMPGLSGYEVCEAIKSEPGLRHIPVLLLTGTFEAFDEARALAAGAAGHVAKPFEAQTLVDRVKQLLASAPPPAAAAPSSAPGPVEATPDAFDFFSEEMAGAESAEAFGDGPLDLDEPDGAFAFGDDELAPSVQEPLGPPATDATAARMRDAGVGAQRADALDFSFDDTSPDPLDDAPMRPDDLGHPALLDPAAGADLDVSSSDLAVDFSSGPTAATGVLETPAAPAAEPAAATDAGDDPFARSEPIDLSDSGFDLTEPEPLDEPAALPTLPRSPGTGALTPPPVPDVDPLVRPFGVGPVPDPGDTIPRRDASAAAAPPLAAPPMDPDPFDVEPMDADAFDAEPLAELDPMGAVDEEIGLSEAALPVDDPFEDAGAAPEPPAAASAEFDSLPPAMREELRDTLEKIAWDAFGQVTEKIVREAIERIERVAWEVVPKLAETMIQEEIRRLKGGSGAE